MKTNRRMVGWLFFWCVLSCYMTFYGDMASRILIFGASSALVIIMVHQNNSLQEELQTEIDKRSGP